MVGGLTRPVDAYNLTCIVHSESGGLIRTWIINGGEGSVRKQPSMLKARTILDASYDKTAIAIDAIGAAGGFAARGAGTNGRHV